MLPVLNTECEVQDTFILRATNEDKITVSGKIRKTAIEGSSSVSDRLCFMFKFIILLSPGKQHKGGKDM